MPKTKRSPTRIKKGSQKRRKTTATQEPYDPSSLTRIPDQVLNRYMNQFLTVKEHANYGQTRQTAQKDYKKVSNTAKYRSARNCSARAETHCRTCTDTKIDYKEHKGRQCIGRCEGKRCLRFAMSHSKYLPLCWCHNPFREWKNIDNYLYEGARFPRNQIFFNFKIVSIEEQKVKPKFKEIEHVGSDVIIIFKTQGILKITIKMWGESNTMIIRPRGIDIRVNQRSQKIQLISIYGPYINLYYDARGHLYEHSGKYHNVMTDDEIDDTDYSDMEREDVRRYEPPLMIHILHSHGRNRRYKKTIAAYYGARVALFKYAKYLMKNKMKKSKHQR